MSKQHPVDTAESPRSIPRRQVLKLGAAGAVLSALSPVLAAEAFAKDPKEKPKGFPVYAPVPQSALGPALNGLGYHVGRVERNLYWVTDGTYQAAFLTTSDGWSCSMRLRPSVTTFSARSTRSPRPTA